MKKANIKVKTIFWLVLLIVALIVMIISSIVVSNTSYITDSKKYFEFSSKIIANASIQRAYAIGAIALSTVIILMGSYIIYAGFKSWNYNAVL